MNEGMQSQEYKPGTGHHQETFETISEVGFRLGPTKQILLLNLKIRVFQSRTPRFW